jgi:hypothetical protein
LSIGYSGGYNIIRSYDRRGSGHRSVVHYLGRRLIEQYSTNSIASNCNLYTRRKLYGNGHPNLNDE